jgi:hypothetical protein
VIACQVCVIRNGATYCYEVCERLRVCAEVENEFLSPDMCMKGRREIHTRYTLQGDHQIFAHG